MHCPKCKDLTLKTGKLADKQLVLDQCSACKGMWFDGGELATLLGDRAKKKFDVPKSSMKLPDVECPRCRVSLYEFCYPGTLTLVDGCKQCAGIWLDSKEWKAISHARDESNDINCPKCQTRQKPAESCKKCGIVIAKYQSASEQKVLNRTSSTTRVVKENAIGEQSYADDIPGLKGTLLRMIDGSIEDLKSSVF